MDGSCLIGICAAVAQAASEAAAAAPPASAASSAAADMREQVSALLTFVGVVSVVWAQLRSRRVVRRYADGLLAFMGAASHKALGLAAPAETVEWTAASLLAGLERRRRAVLGVLVAVVGVYSAVAAVVMMVYAGTAGNPRLSALSVGVSFLMFASFSAPVVLLGVSASNFNRLFWTWCGPATFAAVAMQVMVASITDPQEQLRDVLWALGGVLLLTVGAIVLRDNLPRPLQQRLLQGAQRHPWLTGVLALLAVIVFVLAMALAIPEATFLYLLGGCVVGALAIVLCYFTMVDRIRRIVAPLLAAGYFAFFVSIFAFLALVFPEDSDHGVALTLALLALAGVVGWLARSFMLSWIGLAYEQKVFSDAQFQVFCWMVTVSGVVVCVGTLVRGDDTRLLEPMNLWLLGATALALLLYWAVTRYLIKPLSSNKRLLVLRVFSKDRRGERLLDELEYRWRFIGPIVLIGGKDVAERTIDPAKAANFLRGRLRDIFVPSLHVLHKRVAAMDETPDPDGRYRVNEFFCFDDIWKEAVQMLLDSSDAIVLDLSEFTAERRGTAYELGLLTERQALPRTVFLISAMTDLDAVRAALHVAPGSALPAGSVIQVEHSVDGKQLVEALVARIPASRMQSV